MAWLRTSVALIGFGLAIARFGLFLRELQRTISQDGLSVAPVWLNSQTVGTGLVLAGVTIIVLAVWEYNRVFWQIEQGNFRPNRLMVWITAGIVLVLGLLSIPFVLWQPLSPPPQTPTRLGPEGRSPSDYFSNRMARAIDWAAQRPPRS